MLMCIDEQRNNSNIIIAYRIQDTSTGEVRDFEARELKKYIRNGKLNIINLKLTSDDRLYKIKIDYVKDKDYISYNDCGEIGVKSVPKYSAKEQENINKIMRQEKKVENTKKTFDTMEKIGDIISMMFNPLGYSKKEEKRLAEEKRLHRLNNKSDYINESNVTDEYNSEYDSSESSSDNHGGHGFGAFVAAASALGYFDNDDDDGDDGDFD